MWTLLAHSRLWGDDPFEGEEPSLVFVPGEDLSEVLETVAIKLPEVNYEKYLRFVEEDPEYCYIAAQDLKNFPIQVNFSELKTRDDVIIFSANLNDGTIRCISCNFLNTYALPEDNPCTYVCYKCRLGY